jgi:glycosyltransferase involved in cell wall biosynthesis
MTPKVSVVMPAYNAAAYIRQAAASVLGQTYANVELIIVDDGSRDDTVQLARAIAAADPRVVLIEQPNSGKPSIARNTGIARATGEYLSFLDSDDYWLPERVAAMVAGMQAHPEWVAAFHDLTLVEADETPLPGTYLSQGGFPGAASRHLTALGGGWHECDPEFFIFMSLRYGAVHTQSILIDRRRFESAELRFDEHFIICEDTDLWIRIAMRGKMGYLDASLSCYRQHPTSITRNALLFAEEALKYHRHNQARVAPRMDNGARAAYADKVAALAHDLAYQYYRAGRLKEARALCLRGLRTRPRWADLSMAAKTLLPLGLQQSLRRRLG